MQVLLKHLHKARAWIAGGLAMATATLMVACGGSTTIETAIKPTRVIVFGDGFSDVGNSATGARYVVNEAESIIWAQQVATRFTQTLVASAKGGTGYAQGNARAVNKPDAAGNFNTPTVKEQVDAFLAKDRFGANDLVLIGGGAADIITAVQSTGPTSITQATIKAAALDLTAQVKRIVGAGAKYVLLSGVYNMGSTPWATSLGTATAVFLANESVAYNQRLVVDLVTFGTNVFYVDASTYVDGLILSPASYALTNVTTPACSSVDAGNGIGTGSGQVNSLLCTTATLTLIPTASGTGTVTVPIDYKAAVFADGVYLTSAAHKLYGDYIFDRLKSRW